MKSIKTFLSSFLLTAVITFLIFYLIYDAKTYSELIEYTTVSYGHHSYGSYKIDYPENNINAGWYCEYCNEGYCPKEYRKIKLNKVDAINKLQYYPCPKSKTGKHHIVWKNYNNKINKRI